MKSYFYHQQNFFLDYFEDSIPDDSIIYKTDIPFQNSKREVRYMKFIGNQTGTIFVATKMNNKFLLSQRSNTPNMSNNSNNLGHLNFTKSCCMLSIMASANIGDTLHQLYHTWKRDADAEYLGRVKIVLSIPVDGINFTDPANIRKAHDELMSQVRIEAIHISNK